MFMRMGKAIKDRDNMVLAAFGGGFMGSNAGELGLL
jgi:hypothetical protein